MTYVFGSTVIGMIGVRLSRKLLVVYTSSAKYDTVFRSSGSTLRCMHIQYCRKKSGYFWRKNFWNFVRFWCSCFTDVADGTSSRIFINAIRLSFVMCSVFILSSNCSLLKWPFCWRFLLKKWLSFALFVLFALLLPQIFDCNRFNIFFFINSNQLKIFLLLFQWIITFSLEILV